MPSVAVLPPISAPGFGPSILKMQNGHSSVSRESVAEIKAAAKEQAQRVRGASATSLLRSAKEQVQLARANEGEGDLRGALNSYTKAVVLLTMFMETTEFKQEMRPGKKGVLTQEMVKFQQGEGRDLTGDMQRVESKLVELNRTASRETESDDADGPLHKSGGSIADRLRALQSAGMSTTVTSKRISRELHTSPAPTVTSPPPTSPEVHKTHVNRLSLQGLPLPPPLSASTSSHAASPMMPSTSSHAASPVPSSSTAPSPHTLIPVSSFGPPSPTSSTSSSPRMTASRLSITDFNHNFPSIDELDEMDGLKITMPPGSSASSSAVKTTTTGSSRHSYKHGSDLSPVRQDLQSPVTPVKPFPILPMEIAPRPSSTPIPTVDSFNSRPGSPRDRSPLSPTVPHKPSNLSLNAAARSPLIPQVTPEKRELPTAFFPHTLHEYLQDGRSALILDVRPRDEFEKGHIKAEAVVCIEPSVLFRDKVTSDSIEDSLVVAPDAERRLFLARNNYDVVVLCDESSTSISASPALTSLMRAIYELEFKKILRNMPIILVGGISAWRNELGRDELIAGGNESSLEVPGSNLASVLPSAGLTLPSPQPHTNGIVAPAPRVNGMIPPLAPLPSPSIASSALSAHTRTPAESSTSAQYGSSPLVDGTNMGRSRSGTEPAPEVSGYKMWVPPPSAATPDIPMHSRPGGPPPIPDNKPLSPSLDGTPPLTRRPAIVRPASHSVSNSVSTFSSTVPDNAFAHRSTSSLANGTSSIQYPSFARTSPQISGSSSSFGHAVNGLVSVPPQASINPSPLSRRRSDYIDQSQEALSGITARPPIDYPDLSSQHILRPPPVAASSTMERHDNRPRIMSQTTPKPPMIQSDYPVTYWQDIQIGTSGLKNLGNTCYMNSTIQCLSATVPFARFFTDGRWKSAVNMVNPMGSKGQLAFAFANILRDMWQGEMQCLTPLPFRRTVCTYAKQFAGSEQHDSQEFLSVLLDGLHEDLNRVLQKPNIEMTPEREAELEKLPTQLASEQQWQLYRMRDDSLVVDFFQGQYRSRLECLTCHKTSTTYNTFMYLTLPVPNYRSGSKVTLQQCLDAFVKEEVMEKSDAWNCPSCKTLRKATKLLSLARLPPVLLIHLKRFSVKGHFTEKIETFVDFPLKSLDLTNYMPPPLPPGVSGAPTLSSEDPRAQVPPYRYDLYGVTNHFGTLSGGHYTSFISSRGGWLYCDDSRITPADPKDVVGKPAYILFYKRTKL